MKRWFLCSLLLLGVSSVMAEAPASATHAPRVFCYTNPITRDPALSLRDHCIIKVGAQWFCTGTSNPVWTGPNPGVRMPVSDDLIHWRHHSWLIDASKLPADCPYNGRFWAPEIPLIKGRFWMTVNGGKVTVEEPKGMKTHSVGLFVADAVDSGLVLQRHVIDAGGLKPTYLGPPASKRAPGAATP